MSLYKLPQIVVKKILEVWKLTFYLQILFPKNYHFIIDRSYHNIIYKTKKRKNNWYTIQQSHYYKATPPEDNPSSRSDQTKDYKTGICCFPAKHASLRSRSKDWMIRNQDNVSEWGNMLFQWASTMSMKI